MTLADEIRECRQANVEEALFALRRAAHEGDRREIEAASARVIRCMAASDKEIATLLREARAFELCYDRDHKLAAVRGCAKRNGRRFAIVSAVRP